MCLKEKLASPEYKKKRSIYGKTYSSKPDKKWKIYLIQVRKLYGLSENEYLTLLYKYRGKCHNSMCDKKDIETKLAIDHCHITKKVRGLLCPRCNAFLAYIETAKRHPVLNSGLNTYLEAYA
jgi:hypothetical protein